MRRRALCSAILASEINITVPLDDSGYGEFTDEQIKRITNYCLQFGESNMIDGLPDGFSLSINSIPITTITWIRYNGEIIIQGDTRGVLDFFIGLGDKYVQFN